MQTIPEIFSRPELKSPPQYEYAFHFLSYFQFLPPVMLKSGFHYFE